MKGELHLAAGILQEFLSRSCRAGNYSRFFLFKEATIPESRILYMSMPGQAMLISLWHSQFLHMDFYFF